MNATLKCLSPLERNTEFLDKSLDEVYLPCSHARANPSSPSQLEWRLDFPGATREAPRGHCRNWRILANSRKTTRFPWHRKMRSFHAAASQENSPVPSCILKRYFTTLIQLKMFHTQRSHSRGTASFLAQLNLSPFSPLIST